MELFVDTETTGLTHLSFANERNYRKWPRLVQIAWGVLEGNELTKVHSAIIKPVGFEIPASAELVHGIDDSKASREGCDLETELKLLDEQIGKAERVVAHNIRFDLGVLNSEAIRLGFRLRSPRRVSCTCLSGQAYLKGESGKEEALPKLGSLYRQLFQEEAGNHHDAESDMRICSRVYRRLRELGF
jgi:DNA polymerase-3 subunit alpha